MDILLEIGAYIELFLNTLELIAIIISIFTFLFLMLNKYSKALKAILSPCGFGFRSRIRVLILCRNSATKKRMFLEYAILKTQGRRISNAQWHAIINGFKTFYGSNQTNPIYPIPNCTLLIGTDFSDAVERYFRFFNNPKVKKAFGILDDKLEWVIKIRIEEAYATPTCLLTGLLSKYEEKWEEFIKRYVSTAYISEADDDDSNDILPNELYFTFAWLLWGPSYEISYKTYWAGLCQISYGDESTSIPAVATSDGNVLENLRNKFIENEGRRYGELLSAVISLYDKKSYYKSLRDYINPENAYFYSKAENCDLSFAAQINEAVFSTNYKSKKYYCTAYIWILFELEDPQDFSFRPENSVAFFEHANLTDKDTYTFLIDTLIEKCLKHFRRIFGDPKYSERKYRYVCALNDKIEAAWNQKMQELAAEGGEFGRLLSERIIPTPKRGVASVFTAIDDFFSRDVLITFEDVNILDRKTITDLGKFYTDIYMDCFPDDNERETFDRLLNFLRDSKDSNNYKYHILLAKNNAGEIIGGCVFDYYCESNAGVIEFLCVKSDLQSGGIGSAIYRQVLKTLEKDAYNNRKTLAHIFCEIDSPEHSKSRIKKYLYFWDKNNYKHVDFRYVQPSLSPAQKPVTGLWLAVAVLNGNVASVSGDLVLRVIYDYIKFGMMIDNPERCAQYIAMKQELSERKTVDLTDII